MLIRDLRRIAATAWLLVAVAACGGSGSAGQEPPPAPPPTVTQAEAFRFLNQATFGATEAAADELRASSIDDWIRQQMALPPSLQLPHLRSLSAPQFPFELQTDRVDAWFRNVVNGEDQLRQRVAFALSEIMVVSQLGALANFPYALADYHDMLARNAFGDYRQLLEDITLHPAMGIYLSMLGNEKPDAAQNIRPDENYARELMQLFSIGLVELNLDGTPVLDAGNQPIPTYDQATIEAYAHVYTGWNFAGAPDFRQALPNANNQTLPMQLYADFHDNSEKRLLDGVVLPAGQGGDEDLAMALDSIFQHPNVGPFIAMRLIERLVTSNPSGDYVARVASVFNDNGAGVRGDLGSVVRAILTDPEARPLLSMEIDGKVKEPLLRLTQLWRAYDARSASGRYPLVASYVFFGQGPLQSPSVFNFFSSSYAPPGEIRNSSLVAPELEIATEYQNTLVTNYFFYQVFGLNSTNPDVTADDVVIDIAEELALAGDPAALIDRIDERLLAGTMSATLRAEISGMLAGIPETEAALRAADAIYFVVSSPEFAVQR